MKVLDRRNVFLLDPPTVSPNPKAFLPVCPDNTKVHEVKL